MWAIHDRLLDSSILPFMRVLSPIDCIRRCVYCLIIVMWAFWLLSVLCSGVVAVPPSLNFTSLENFLPKSPILCEFRSNVDFLSSRISSVGNSQAAVCWKIVTCEVLALNPSQLLTHDAADWWRSQHGENGKTWSNCFPKLLECTFPNHANRLTSFGEGCGRRLHADNEYLLSLAFRET